jgi:hypothetical protein
LLSVDGSGDDERAVFAIKSREGKKDEKSDDYENADPSEAAPPLSFSFPTLPLDNNGRRLPPFRSSTSQSSVLSQSNNRKGHPFFVINPRLGRRFLLVECREGAEEGGAACDGWRDGY